MPTFDRFDVISVPFPYTDKAARERRPALIISMPDLEQRYGLLWAIMITAAENAAWLDDITIPDHRAVGLSIPSIIRPSKIATVEAIHARFRGKLPLVAAQAVEAAIKVYLPFPHH